MRYLKTAIAAAALAPLFVHAQIKKVLITDFIYGSTHTEGRPLCQALVKEIGTDLGFTVEVAAAEGKITADYLKGFDLVVWNSMSQNGLQSATAKAAWQAWLEGGGASGVSRTHRRQSPRLRAGYSRHEVVSGGFAMATYVEIQKFVQRHHGFIPKTGWITHVKNAHGMPTLRGAKGPRRDRDAETCPAEKREAIEEALRHFRMIS